MTLLREKCVETLSPDRARCAELLEKSLAFAASYIPALGYDTVSEIVKTSADADAARRALDEAVHASGTGGIRWGAF